MGIVVAQPYKMFFDRDGNPLENGYIYVGIENMNAETNPITIYWDEALTLAGAQPIRTLAGYPVRNGTPANIFVSADYSITVRDKNLALVYSSPNGSLISDDFGSAIHNAAEDASPDDADEVPMWDTATAALGKFTIANLIAKLVALTSTWGISTTGNAATATLAATATNALACSGNSATATLATTATNVSGGTVSATTIAGTTGTFSSHLLVNGVAVLGYTTGAGGTVTQATSKSTGVTLDKPTGVITMHNASLAAGAVVVFQLTNTWIPVHGGVVPTIVFGTAANPESYLVTASTLVGGAIIAVRNLSAGAIAEAIQINFQVFYGADS